MTEEKKRTHVNHGCTKEHRRLVNIWHLMRLRCTAHRDKSYARYGGRGITVCDAWTADIKVFISWAQDNGYRADLTLDRIDNDGPYSPDNCRWIPLAAQARNRRDTYWVEAYGETKCLSAWAEDARCQVPRDTLKDRLERGIQPETAMLCSGHRMTDAHLRQMGTVE